ncbi:hypothetical protein BC829DRAFT_235304 [Chytridium lagenaria]|nr:hypothetical protein BC829DRAFT_235304 [Chytridium lagenaria]
MFEERPNHQEGCAEFLSRASTLSDTRACSLVSSAAKAAPDSTVSSLKRHRHPEHHELSEDNRKQKLKGPSLVLNSSMTPSKGPRLLRLRRDKGKEVFLGNLFRHSRHGEHSEYRARDLESGVLPEPGLSSTPIKKGQSWLSRESTALTLTESDNTTLSSDNEKRNSASSLATTFFRST